MIADFLDSTEKSILSLNKGLENLLQLLDQKRSAIITQTITKGLNSNVLMKDSKIDWVHEIPSHWNVSKIKYVMPLQNHKSATIPSGVKYIALENIEARTGKLLLETDITEVGSSVSIFRKNDILFGKLRPYLAKVILAEFSGVCSNELIVLRPSSKSEGEYYQKLLLSNPFIQYVNATANGVKMPRANPGIFSAIKIPIPPLNEMQEIGENLNEMIKQISILSIAIRDQIQSLKEYKTAIISAAVTGKIDLRRYFNG